jgi:hypothetical protein
MRSMCSGRSQRYDQGTIGTPGAGSAEACGGVCGGIWGLDEEASTPVFLNGQRPVKVAVEGGLLLVLDMAVEGGVLLVLGSDGGQ